MTRRLALGLAVLLAALPAAAKERKVHETAHYPLAAGRTVTVDVADTDVALRTGDIEDLVLTTELSIAGAGEGAANKWIAGHTPIVDRLDGGLAIRIPPARYGFLALGALTARARIGIVMRADAIPDVTTTSGDIRIRGDFAAADPLRLRTSTGDAEFLGAARSVDFRTTSGDLRIDVVRPLERLFARTASGDVTLQGGARELHADTASGDVWAAGLSGSVTVETSKGKVTLRWDRVPDGAVIRVHNHSGRTRLSFPPGVSPKGTIRTVSGTIRCALPGTVGEEGTAVTLEGDGPVLDLATDSGEIVVDTGEAAWEVAPASAAAGGA